MRGFSFFVHKNFLITLGVLVSISAVTGIMLYLRGDIFPKKKTASVEVSPFVLAGAIAREDSDGDSLYDWEEQLWKTDPQNPDSDGDGTKDGEEVRNNRNPLLAGNDLVAKESVALGADASVNLTDEVAKSVYSNIVALEYFNAYDEQTKKKLALQAAKELEAQLTPPPLDISKIRTTTDTSSESVKRYQKAIGSALLPFAKNAERVGENDLGIITRAITKKDPAAYAELEKLIALYDEFITALYTIEVPEDARTMHTEMIRTTIAYRHELLGASAAQSDPLRALASMQSYATTMSTMYVVTGQLEVYFKQKGIIQ